MRRKIDVRVRRRNDKHQSRFFIKMLKIMGFILLSYAAIKIGVLSGNILSNADAKMIENIDVQSFKRTLNSSLPIIDSVYNSGNVGTSFAGEIKGLVKKVFGFDLNDPVTILGAQSPALTSYYNNEYQDYLAQRNRDSSDEGKQNDGEDKSQQDGASGFKPPIESSISTNESNEETNRPEGGVVSYKNISIQNQTKYKIDINKLMSEPLNIKFAKSGPEVLIYHTHTTESYLTDISQINKTNVANRSIQCKNGVVTVGDQLAQYLRNLYDIGVIHNGTINDYPDFNSSYFNGLETVNKILKGNSSVRVVIDLHRDGLGGNKKLRVVKKINGRDAAQIMFVIGTDASGLNHPNWKENLKFAIKLQEKLNKECPGLAKPIYLSSNRYNQHVTNGAMIIEVGGDGNLVGEALESTKYLAKVLNEVICELK
jgi:stage II sporulation protein P